MTHLSVTRGALVALAVLLGAAVWVGASYVTLPVDELRGALVALAVLLGAAVWVGVSYSTLPVDELRGALVYRPYGSSQTRVAGLGVAENVRLDEVPEVLLVALLSNEDKKFFTHHGFDFEEIGNSLRESWTQERRLRGASTLTQQLARALFLSPARSFGRKLTEAVYTVKLERTLPKAALLTLYVNNVEWAPGVYGIRQAAAHYFSKPPSDLSRTESAFLVAILPNPELFGSGLTEGRLSSRGALRVRRVLEDLEQIDLAGAVARPGERDEQATQLVASVRQARQDAQAQARRP